jgi:hypothetical protein
VATYGALAAVLLLPFLMFGLMTGRWKADLLRQTAVGAGPGLGMAAVLITLSVIFGARLKKAVTEPARRGPRGWAPALLGPLIFLSLMGLFASFQRGSYLARLADTLPMGLLMLGFSVVGLCVYRNSKGKFCAGCGYELSPEMEAGSDAESRCPECGGLWMLTGGTIQGQRRFRSRPLVVGLAVVALGLLMMRAAFPGGRSMVLRLLPTSSLIAEVTQAPRGFTISEWAELSRRTLSAAQERRLAEGLLGLRERKQYLAREADGWLENAALAGRLPPELIDRYFSGMMEIWLLAPGRGEPGGKATLGLGAEHRGPLGPPATLRPLVLFDGFAVGEATGIGRADTLVDGISFGDEVRSFGRVSKGRGPGREVALPAGRTEVRAAYWLLVMPATPPSSGATLARGPAGEPVIPAAAVWARRFELSAVIE